MDNQKQIDFLKKQIEDAIGALYKRRKNNKGKTFYIQMTTTILSSISTIILGLKIEDYQEFTRITALVISTLITIIVGVDAFYNHKRLWLTYADTLNEMYSLRFDLDYRLLASAELTNEELANFKNKYQSILDSSNQKWMKLREDNSPAKK